MISKIQTRYAVWIPYVIFAAALLSFSIGFTGDIFIVDEARNAACAREMLESGNYIVPTFNYELRTDKPPLHYYFMMISYSIFGVSEWSARLFSILFGALTLFITYKFANRWLGIRSALWTGIVMLSSIHVSIQFHMSVPDPYLIFFFTASLFLFFEAFQTKSKIKAYLMYICMALGVLAKGPIAIALPGLIMLILLIQTKQLTIKNIWAFRPIEGILILALIALPWYYAVHMETGGEWTRGFFLEHNIERFSSTKENHGGTFLMAPLFVLLGLLPFSAFFIKAYRFAFQQRKKQVVVLALIASIVIVVFFAISSTRLPNYTAPAYPFIAILLGHYLAQGKLNKFKVELIVILCISILFVPAAFVAFRFEIALQSLQYYVLLLSPAAIGSILALRQYQKGFTKQSLRTIAIVFFICSLSVSYLMYSRIARENPVRKTLSEIQATTPVAYYKKFNQSFPFYLKRKIRKLKDESEIQLFFEEHPNGILITQKKKIKGIKYSHFAEVIVQQKDLFEGGTTIVLRLKQQN